MKIKKKNLAGSGWGGGGGVRVDVNEELKFLCSKKKLGWGREGEGSGLGGQGGCERRIEKFFGKIHKKKNSRGGGGVGLGGGGGGSGWM